ncbi:hypothetical protein [Kineosporia babensis]|uniref:Uncharacterized protein n=1 Tax=Kineosporia babensis TaxID=499548 RepID=A0A9X1NDI3_9ACTN|nr:hypothetical protein [Kineosporia babensis]MCD5312982.1 hypothetical protein [Kineosporia babensis]
MTEVAVGKTSIWITAALLQVLAMSTVWHAMRSTGWARRWAHLFLPLPIIFVLMLHMASSDPKAWNASMPWSAVTILVWLAALLGIVIPMVSNRWPTRLASDGPERAAPLTPLSEHFEIPTIALRDFAAYVAATDSREPVVAKVRAEDGFEVMVRWQDKKRLLAETYWEGDQPEGDHVMQDIAAVLDARDPDEEVDFVWRWTPLVQ